MWLMPKQTNGLVQTVLNYVALDIKKMKIEESMRRLNS